MHILLCRALRHKVLLISLGTLLAQCRESIESWHMKPTSSVSGQLVAAHPKAQQALFCRSYVCASEAMKSFAAARMRLQGSPNCKCDAAHLGRGQQHECGAVDPQAQPSCRSCAPRCWTSAVCCASAQSRSHCPPRPATMNVCLLTSDRCSSHCPCSHACSHHAAQLVHVCRFGPLSSSVEYGQRREAYIAVGVLDPAVGAPARAGVAQGRPLPQAAALAGGTLGVQLCLQLHCKCLIRHLYCREA